MKLGRNMTSGELDKLLKLIKEKITENEIQKLDVRIALSCKNARTI